MPLQEYRTLKQITVPVYKWAISVNGSNWYDLRAVQSLNPDESMDLTESYVIGGLDGGNVQPFELVPGNVTGKTLDLSVVVLHGADVTASGKEDALKAFNIGTVASPIAAYDWMQVMDLGFKFYVREQKVYYSGTTLITDTYMYEDCYVARVSTPKNITGGDLREIAALTINYTRANTPTV